MPDIKKKIKFEKEQNSLFNDLLNILNYNNNNVFIFNKVGVLNQQRHKRLQCFIFNIFLNM